MSKLFTENWKQFWSNRDRYYASTLGDYGNWMVAVWRNEKGARRVVNVPWCADEFDSISYEFSRDDPDPDFKPSPLEKELYNAFHQHKVKFYPRILWDYWKKGCPDDDYEGMIAEMRWDEEFYCL